MNTCAPRLGQTVTSFEAPKRLVNKVYLHYSAAQRSTVDAVEVDRWHREDNNWDCIGYHYFLKTDGTLQYGRDLERQPAAQYGHNTDTIAICLNGLYVEDFTNEQYEKLRWICNEINHSLDVTFHGHLEVGNTPCPVFDYVSVLGLEPGGVMPKLDSPKPPSDTELDIGNLPDNWQARIALIRMMEAEFWAKESRKA